MITIIPKSEIDRKNTLRFELSQKIQIFSHLVFEFQKTHPNFIGTLEQIDIIEDNEKKSEFLKAYNECVKSSEPLEFQNDWFRSVQVRVKILKKFEEENKGEDK